MREQLGAQHGTFVHKRPCYEKALAAKKQQAADTQPMEVEQENNPPPPSFHNDVRQHAHMNERRLMHMKHTHSHSLSLFVRCR